MGYSFLFSNIFFCFFFFNFLTYFLCFFFLLFIRCIITKVLPNPHFCVLLCDLGEVSVLSNDNLKTLPAKFRELPKQAIKAKLYGNFYDFLIYFFKFYKKFNYSTRIDFMYCLLHHLCFGFQSLLGFPLCNME